MFRFASLLIPFCLLVAGCASNLGSIGASKQMGNLLLAEPAPVHARTQLAIARYNQILSQAPLKDEERAELLYQRGMLYDSAGLPGLALYDFNNAIKLKPDMAEAYNSRGIHFTQQMEFIQAYEQFDSTLDINPDYDFAFLNRGIALYYGGRPDLAVSDFGTFYQKDESDPYRALWNFIALNEVDEQLATAELRANLAKLSQDNWATKIVELYLGDIGETELLNTLVIGVENQQQLTDRLCEVYFYLGKYHNARGNNGVASNYFKLALSTNVYDYVEHRYARLELNIMREQAYRDRITTQ